MAKRVYWESLKSWAIKAGITTGSAGFALLFYYLIFIQAIVVTGYSKDMVCAGTIEDPCLAFINFSVNEDIFLYPTGYDPYGRDTPFFTDVGLSSWKIYRSWGSSWREIKLNQTCTSPWCGAPPNSPDNKYAFAFRKDRDYKIKIVAYKNDPSEDIKWGFGPVDPLWEGVGGNLIDNIGKDWKFNITYLDELNVTIEDLGNNTFKLTPIIYNHSKVNKIGYKWKMEINYTEGNGHKNIKVKQNKKKEDLNESIFFTIPEEINNFKLSIGESSTLVDASASSIATSYGNNKNICRDSKGMMHIAYEGGSSDSWYGNSSNGIDWDIKEIRAGTVTFVGIVCTPSDEIITYMVDSTILWMYNSTDGGVTFDGPSALASGELNILPSCASDSNGVMHCCFIAGGDLWYVNSTVLDAGKRELSITDSDHCNIGVDSNDNIIIPVSDSTEDDLDYMTSEDGWTSRTLVDGDMGSVTNNFGRGISIAIDSEDNLHFAGSFTSDLWYCNGSSSTFDCQEIDASTSYNADISLTEKGEIYIIYSNDDDGTAGNVYRSNSTNGASWNVRREINAGGFGSVAYSNYPAWNNITDQIHMVFTLNSDVYYTNFSVAPPPGDNPPYFIDGTPVNQTLNNITALSYEINATDDLAFDCFAVNDTTNFKINCDGLLENNTNLAVGLYNLNITINDTSNNLNSTLMWVNVTEFIFIPPDLNFSVALPLGFIRFLNCSPDFENSDSRPDGQTSTIGSINATNNSSSSESLTINLTGSLNPGWTIWASNDSLVNNLTLSTTAQTIWSNVAAGETKKIWLAGNCSKVSSNPGQSIDMQAV